MSFLLEAIALYGAASQKLIFRIEKRKELNPLEKVKTYFATLIDKNRKQQFKYSCFWGNVATELAGKNEKVSLAIQQEINIVKKQLTIWLIAAKDQNLLIEVYTPSQLADFLYSNFHGAMVSMKYEQSAKPLEDFLELNFKLLSIE